MNTTHLLCIHCRTHMYQIVYHLLVSHWRFCTKIQNQREINYLLVANNQFILTYLFSWDEHTYLTRPIRFTTQAWGTCSCLCAVSLSPINVALKDSLCNKYLSLVNIHEILWKEIFSFWVWEVSIFTWHVAEVKVASVIPAKLVALQLGSSPIQAELVPPPAFVPQIHDPP